MGTLLAAYRLGWLQDGDHPDGLLEQQIRRMHPAAWLSLLLLLLMLALRVRSGGSGGAGGGDAGGEIGGGGGGSPLLLFFSKKEKHGARSVAEDGRCARS